MRQATRPRGRPRPPDTDQKILAATLELLGRDGYARMSVDAIATLAGVTKPTIYLRWPSKAALTAAALLELAASRERTAPAETGDTYADLVAQVRHFQGGVSRPFGISLVGAVLAEEHETPHLLALYREHIVAPRRALLRRVLEHAQERGEVRADLDLDLVVNMLVGAYYAQYLAGAPFPDDWAEQAVSTALRSLLTPPLSPE